MAQSDSGSSDDDEEVDAAELKNKAIEDIQGEMSASENEESASSDSEEKDVIKMDFGKKDKKKKQEEGLMNMKFMKTAEGQKRERLKKEAEMLIDQIKDEEQFSGEEEQPSKKKETGGLFNSLGKFGASQAPKIDTAEVLKAAKEIYAKQQAEGLQGPEEKSSGHDESSSEDDS